MRPASSRMPARGGGPASSWQICLWIAGIVALFAVFGYGLTVLVVKIGVALGWWNFAKLAAVAFAVVWVLTGYSGRRVRRRYRQRAAERSGHSICTFGRSFDLRTIDPWIVRAVYEEFTDQARAFQFAPTVLPTDRLEEIIPDDEDLTDAVVDIAQRCRRELPVRFADIGPASSVRDLIHWLNTHAT